MSNPHSPISSLGMREVPPSSQTCAHPSHLEKSSPGDSPSPYFLSFTLSFLYKNYSLVEVICWLNLIKQSSFRETQRIMIEMVCINKTQKHGPNTQRKITLEKVSYYENKFKTTPSTNNYALFPMWWKKNLVKHKKISKS